MASASFTRDEVILALDVFYSSPKGRVTADSDEIKITARYATAVLLSAIVMLVNYSRPIW